MTSLVAKAGRLKDPTPLTPADHPVLLEHHPHHPPPPHTTPHNPTARRHLPSCNPPRAAKRPSGQAATDAAGLVSGVPVIRDLPSQTLQRSFPPLAPFSPMAVLQVLWQLKRRAVSVSPCHLVSSPLPHISVIDHLSLMCLIMSGINPGQKMLVSRLLLSLLSYTNLLAVITKTTRYQKATPSRFIHCHSFFFSLLCSLPLLCPIDLTDDQEK